MKRKILLKSTFYIATCIILAILVFFIVKPNYLDDIVLLENRNPFYWNIIKNKCDFSVNNLASGDSNSVIVDKELIYLTSSLNIQFNDGSISMKPPANTSDTYIHISDGLDLQKDVKYYFIDNNYYLNNTDNLYYYIEGVTVNDGSISYTVLSDQPGSSFSFDEDFDTINLVLRVNANTKDESISLSPYIGIINNDDNYDSYRIEGKNYSEFNFSLCELRDLDSGYISANQFNALLAMLKTTYLNKTEWFTIMLGNGKGLEYIDGNPYDCYYGDIDSWGRIKENGKSTLVDLKQEITILNGITTDT